VLAYPRAGISRGVYSEAPSAATGCIAAFATDFFGPLAAVFLAVFFAASHWPLGLGNNRCWTGTPPGQPGRYTRRTSSPAGTVVGDPGTCPDAAGAPG
jgi:hypothetical protein